MSQTTIHERAGTATTQLTESAVHASDFKQANSDDALRVEAVDSHHPAWDRVRSAIDRAGDSEALLLHDDGRLSARQTVLAAFAEDELIGHLCFRVEPARSRGRSRITIRAKLDSFAINQEYAGSMAERRLHDIANERARLLRCRGPRLYEVAAG